MTFRTRTGTSPRGVPQRRLRAMAAGAALVLLAAGCVNPPGGDGGTTPSTPGGPVAVANASPTVGDAPLTVSFSSSGSNLGDGTGVLFTWDFGDGSPFGTGASVIHVYEEVGTYQAQLTISTTLGTSVSAPITIVVNQSVNPAFHVRPGGSTGPDCGPLLDPCSTITQAQQNALENGVRTIKVAGGVYGPLQVASGMEILGGFLSDFSAVSPAVTSVVLGTGDSDPVTFDGVSNATINRIHAVGVVRTSGDAVGVRVTGGSSGIQIQASEVAGGEGPNATGVVVEQQSSVAIAATRVNSGTTVGEGSSAYGVRVVQRSSAHISASAITAQRGADGVDAPSAVPPRGANGCPGRNGGSGSGANGAGAGGLGGKPDPNGGCIGGVASANPSPINGGDGGKGKGDSSSIAQPGKPGGPNGTGGAGGASGGHHDPGGAGGAGRSGDAGEAGKAGINDPDVAAGVLWSPPDGTPGGDGQDGTGGGGGGGGGEGALITSGGGGGGGGGAGKGGKGGVAGGTSGGGSFGIYAHDSFVTVTSNTTVTAAEGGRGGNGAPGGKGGNGAKGGNGGGKSCCAADGGGGGGGGGAGGGGAGAGGGAGGPSIALFNEGTGTLTRNVSEANLKVASTTAPGGLGGAGSAAATPGGSSSGADGAPGGPAAPPGKPGPAGFDGPSGLTVRIWDNG